MRYPGPSRTGSNYSVSSIGAVFLPVKSAIRLGNHFSNTRGLMKPQCAQRSLRTETNVRSLGLLSGFVYVRGACLCLRNCELVIASPSVDLAPQPAVA